MIKFAGVPVLSVRFFKKAEGTLPQKTFGSKVNFFSTRRDTVNFAFVYHTASKEHNHVLEPHTLNVESKYSP